MSRRVDRILVTGASGFLGRTIARHFTNGGFSVFGVDRRPADALARSDLSAYVSLSLPDPAFASLILEWKPEAVIHAAGGASVPHSMMEPAVDFQDGPVATFGVLEVLRKHAPECGFINLSSAAVYGNPVSLPMGEEHPLAPVSAYGYHKVQGELLCAEFCRLFGLKTVSVRPFSAYGPGLRRQVVWDIAVGAMNQPELTLQGDGTESRDFVHSEDLARALDVVLQEAPMNGEAYNIASGEETTIGQLAGLIVESLEKPVKISFSGALPAGTPRNWRADNRRLARLGFTPRIPLADGVRAFINWCRSEVGNGGLKEPT